MIYAKKFFEKCSKKLNHGNHNFQIASIYAFAIGIDIYNLDWLKWKTSFFH